MDLVSKLLKFGDIKDLTIVAYAPLVADLFVVEQACAASTLLFVFI